jgi:hypothetical protein
VAVFVGNEHILVWDLLEQGGRLAEVGGQHVERVSRRRRAAFAERVSVSATSKANDPESYPNKRSELWFSTAQRARENQLDLSGIASDQKGTRCSTKTGSRCA